MSAEQEKRDGVLPVNWLRRGGLFDFDHVEVIQSTEEQVERFAMQVANDTDPSRRPRYRGMVCRVSADCGLPENTVRILASLSDRVESC